MPLLPYSLARPFLFGLDPEAAHDLTMESLARLQGTPLSWAWCAGLVDDPIDLAGLTFPNRVGLAAGLDKNARAIDGLGAMGFGFVEVGTVTPRPQPGNPKPRMFRLPQASALINRLGFNNDGLDAFIANVQRSSSFRRQGRILGLNIGKNAATPIESATQDYLLGLAAFVANVQRARFRQQGRVLGLNIGKNASTPIERATDDYLAGLAGVYPHADYVTVNISSPNTKNLRALQGDEALDALLAALADRRAALAAQHGRRVPLFVKIAPDLDEAQVVVIAASLQRHGMDGVIATNTTVARDHVQGLPHAQEAGGLSGGPLLEASNRVIRQLRAALGSAFPIIGVGGVLSAPDALAKLRAGADLVQIYTGLIYRGPGLVDEIARALRAQRGSGPGSA